MRSEEILFTYSTTAKTRRGSYILDVVCDDVGIAAVWRHILIYLLQDCSNHLVSKYNPMNFAGIPMQIHTRNTLLMGSSKSCMLLHPNIPTDLLGSFWFTIVFRPYGDFSLIVLLLNANEELHVHLDRRYVDEMLQTWRKIKQASNESLWTDVTYRCTWDYRHSK